MSTKSQDGEWKEALDVDNSAGTARDVLVGKGCETVGKSQISVGRWKFSGYSAVLKNLSVKEKLN